MVYKISQLTGGHTVYFQMISLSPPMDKLILFGGMYDRSNSVNSSGNNWLITSPPGNNSTGKQFKQLTSQKSSNQTINKSFVYISVSQSVSQVKEGGGRTPK